MSNITVSPAVAGFLKGIFLVAVFAIIEYVANSANLTGVLSPSVAVVVSAIASAIESSMKAKSNGATGLYGALKIQK